MDLHEDTAGSLVDIAFCFPSWEWLPSQWLTCMKRVGSSWERVPAHLPSIHPRESVPTFTPHVTATHIHSVCPLSKPDYLAVEALGICVEGLWHGDLRSG